MLFRSALPWDTIPPARYLPYDGYSKQLPRLRTLSKQRQTLDPDFKYLNAQIALAETLKKDTVISLNAEVRKKEQEELDQKRLAVENARRQEKGQELLKTWREAEAAADPDGNPDTVEAPDPTAKEKPEDEAYIREAGQVLLDAILAPPLKMVQPASPRPATAAVR